MEWVPKTRLGHMVLSGEDHQHEPGASHEATAA